MLHRAVQFNSLSVVEVLLRRGVDVEQKDNKGYTPLASASHSGHTEIVRLLWNNQASPNTINDAGNRPLHHAASQEHEETMQFLIENGADIDAINSKKATALLVAAQRGKLASVRLLADHGADLKMKGMNNFTALHYATAAKDKPLVRFLLKRGLDIEAETLAGQTALSRAAGLGLVDMVLLLLECGADVSTTAQEGWTPLHYAAFQGVESVVEALLDHGADPVAETLDGRRPESVAQEQGHIAIAKMLKNRTPVSKKASDRSASQTVAMFVSAAEKGNCVQVSRFIKNDGIDVNAMDLDGRRAICVSAENGHESVLDLLIENEADLDLTDMNGQSALWWASRYGHEKVVRRLLSKGAPVDSADFDGQTPLSTASQKGHAGIVELLLKKGGDPNTTVKYGRTALLFAAAGGYLRIADLLIKAGAEVDFKDPNGRTALSVAKAQGHDELANLLQHHSALDSESNRRAKNAKDLSEAAAAGRVAEIRRLIRAGANVDGTKEEDADGGTPLVRAAIAGQTLAITTLIKEGADVNRRSKNSGGTATSFAAGYGHTSAVRLLYEHGAKLNQVDNSNRTPLSYAAEYGHEDVVELLLKLGAKKEIKDEHSITPLLHAARNRHKGVVEILIRKGANVESGDYFGYTPLTQACRNGDRDLVRFLLGKGARMRPESTSNCSPLCIAAVIGAESIVELLIDHGADLNHFSDNRETPLILAAQNGFSMVAKILIEAGADVNLTDDDGRTPLSHAKEHGHESIVKLLSQAVTLRQVNERAMRKMEQETLVQRKRYQYQPLSGRGREGHIRVLELSPGKRGDIISFELTEIDLYSDKRPSFEALSYEWREKIGTVPVQCGKDRLLITPNCKAALERLRLESGRRTLWIDAVCINQEDSLERTQQVAMMTDIYRKAKAVLMWVGEEKEEGGDDDSMASAFTHIPVLAQVYAMLRKDPGGSSFEQFSLEERADAQELARGVMADEDAIAGLHRLFWVKYFTRAWIFQEIILANSRGIVMCGSHECPWETFKAGLLGYRACSAANNPTFYEIVRIDDLFAQDGEVDLFQTSSSMSVFEASDARDKIFATLRLASVVETPSIKRPVADYSLTVQQVYVDAARYFIDRYQSVHIWTQGSRHSTKEIPNLPTWVPNFTKRWGDLEHDQDAFALLTPEFSQLIAGRPTTTPVALHIDGCILDRVAFKVAITKGTDVYDIVIPTVQALARFGRSIYDPFPDGNSEEQEQKERMIKGRKRISKSGSSKAKKSVRFQKRTGRGGGSSRSSERDPPSSSKTNGQAILSMIFNSYGTSPENDAEMAAYLAWRLSKDENTPESSKEPPESLKSLVAAWESRSRAWGGDFDLAICQRMESQLRYERDLVYTERGHFGLTNKDEAEEGLVVAFISGAPFLSLLREKRVDQERWYEYVDCICMGYLLEKTEMLEDLTGKCGIDRLEIR